MIKIKNIAQILLAIIVMVLVMMLFTTSKAQVRECVTQSFTSQIGVRESTGRNDGVDVKKYLKSTKLNEGFAWCAAFVNWNLMQCGVNGANSAWSPDWFPKAKVIYIGSVVPIQSRVPTQGDVFGIYFAAKKRIAHVGFILIWNDDSVTTVEGNTNAAGSREGDGVYKKIRLKKQIYKVSNWIDL